MGNHYVSAQLPEMQHQSTIQLKGTDTFGNCQRPVFSLGVSQHKYKNLWKFGLNWSSNFEKIIKEKTPLLHKFVCFQMPEQDFRPEVFLGYKVWNYLFLKNCVTSEWVACTFKHLFSVVCIWIDNKMAVPWLWLSAKISDGLLNCWIYLQILFPRQYKTLSQKNQDWLKKKL